MISVESPTTFQITEQQEQLAEFYNKYEELVDLLCSAAQYSNPNQVPKYSELKYWMERNYFDIKPFITPFIILDESVEALNFNSDLNSIDPFEALFFADTLNSLLQNDDGKLINLITLTRKALYSYADSFEHYY